MTAYRTPPPEPMVAIADATLPAETFRGRRVLANGLLASNVRYFWGPNHLEGEVVLGIAPHDGVVLTDRRLATMHDGALYVIRYEDLTDVREEKHLLGNKLRLDAHGGGIALKHERDTLHAFFARVLELSPDERRVASTAADAGLDVAQAGGVEQAERALLVADARLRTLVRLAWAAVARGTIDASRGAALMRRVSLLDRTLHTGRGMDDDWKWLTALSREDLLAVFVDRIGTEPREHGDGEYVFAGGGGGGGPGVYVGTASLGVGPAIGAGMLAARSPRTLLRLTIDDGGDPVRFKIEKNLLGTWTDLAYDSAAPLFDAMMHDVLAYDFVATLLRLLFGDDDAMSELTSRSREEVGAAASALEDGVSLEAFWGD